DEKAPRSSIVPRQGRRS
ncbi:micro-fibrillar-associated protein 1 C-terminus protein, partial [Toxoplasma gondii RUB]